MKELIKIQQELKAPKSQFNNFGKYNYRNLEDILEAVKPILKELECYLIISDQIIQIGDRYYIKAIARLTNKEGVSVENTSYARESFDKKGMDDSQITGATSSYARKYALNGLFLIDDTKDADNDDNSQNKPLNGSKTNENTSGASLSLATEKQLNMLKFIGSEQNWEHTDLIYTINGKEVDFSKLTSKQASAIIGKYKGDNKNQESIVGDFENW